MRVNAVLFDAYGTLFDVHSVAASLKLPMSDAAHQRLLDAYLALKPFPENLSVLGELHAAGLILGTLSNGTNAMLDAALESAGMRGLLTHVLSVDSARCYKTSARAYELGTQALGIPADRIAFVSSNCWDAIGATWYGYQTFWVNRQHAPLEELGASPAGTGSSLSDLPQFLE
ncbi:MAG: haloacid dehalogenase type II [Casimicrobiaceae bacterium]